MKNNELNMENMEQVGGGATQEIVEAVKVPDYRQEEEELTRKLEQQKRKFDELSQELMAKIGGGATKEHVEMEEPCRPTHEEIKRGLNELNQEMIPLSNELKKKLKKAV